MGIKKETIKINGFAYLCHPVTTYGTLEENKESAKIIQDALSEKYQLSIINTTTIINRDTNATHEWIMEKCKGLLKLSAALILCPKWYLSRGCKQEVLWAMEWNMDIYLYSAETNELSKADYESLRQILSTVELYNDININIRHDESLIYINYFGNQYAFSKTKKQILIPENDDALKASVNPLDYIEDVGRGISLYNQLPEEYRNLLTEGADYGFFFGNSDQLCIKSDGYNEQIYFNKYSAYILLHILRSNGDIVSFSNIDPHKDFVSIREHQYKVIFSYYVDGKGKAQPKYLPDGCGHDLIHIYYDKKEDRITIVKDGISFELTNLEMRYLEKLLYENCPERMAIKLH